MVSSTYESSGVTSWEGEERDNSFDCSTCTIFARKIREARESRESRILKGAIDLTKDVVGTTAAIGLGLLVFNATGLAEAESGLLKVLLGTGTVLWMVVMVRLGLLGE